MRVFSTSAPEFATPCVMARTTGFLYLAGGLSAGIVGAALGAHPVSRIVVLAAAAAALAGSAATLRWGRHLPRWTFQLLVLVGTGLITLVVAVAPDGASAVALAAIFVFIAVDAFLFFAWPEALLHLVVMVVAQAVGLARHDDVGVEVWVALSVLWIAVAAVVRSIVRGASRAIVDSLTGVANRRGWDDALEAALAAAKRRLQPLSVALVDVDHFKEVNDERGHAVGDDLLRTLARDWSATLPDGVLLARRGGDEFAVLLPGRAGPEALAVVDGMRQVGRYQSVSCGVAEHVPGETGGDLLRRADVALYTAKASGRGRAVLSGGEHDALAGDLAAALERDEVDVAFQPVIALPGREVVGVEALARWVHPDRGPIVPADFVPVAEASELVGDLGAVVLRRACRGALLLERAWRRELLLAVNVSGHELAEPGYADRLVAILAETGWPAHRLVVEVTESLLERPASSALAALEELRGHGIAVAIDDFGTGRSAFSQLDAVPADYLKLDPSFIEPITTSPRRTAMLRALLDLSRHLGLQVIAEGVETQEQSDLLVEFGCPLAQGYLFGRPASAQQGAVPAPRVSGARAGGAVGA